MLFEVANAAMPKLDPDTSSLEWKFVLLDSLHEIVGEEWMGHESRIDTGTHVMMDNGQGSGDTSPWVWTVRKV